MAERLVRTRLRRQQILDRDPPPKLSVVLDESVLRDVISSTVRPGIAGLGERLEVTRLGGGDRYEIPPGQDLLELAVPPDLVRGVQGRPVLGQEDFPLPWRQAPDDLLGVRLPAPEARDPAFQDQLMDRLAALTGIALF